jgi:RNA polymerase sigma-70 factor (TIGR02960 family)
MTDPTLARAQAGDGDAFEELVSPYRRELHVHCYRFLGSFHDAEDVLQETLLSAWQGLDRFDGRSLRAWLYRIATNRCLNYFRDASRRPKVANLPESRYPLASAARSDDPWWLEPYPDALIEVISPGPEARYDARQSIALSFVAGLQHLPAQQRAALVLRDVLGFSASEAAEMLDSTLALVNSALQRARSGFRPAGDRERIALLHSGQEAEVIGRFVDAYEGGDVASLVALLSGSGRRRTPGKATPSPQPADGCRWWRSTPARP